MSFEEIAKRVIKRSIRSAVCIDDDFASAFSYEKELNYDTPRKLYNSFREEGLCDLDIYNFKSITESWHPEYMLNNKDLMILDWELGPSGRFESAVKILCQVVESKQVPLIIIYTATEDLNTIAKTLISTFTPFSKDHSKAAFQEIEKQFSYITEDQDSYDLLQAFESVLELSYEYIYQYSQRDRLYNEIIELLANELSIKEEHFSKVPGKLLTIIKNKLEANDGEEFLAFCHLICSMNDGLCFQKLQRIKIQNLSFRIGSSSVLIFKKDGVQVGIKPEQLFTKFSEVLVSDPNNFLSLLSLELRDNIREKYNEIGMEFSQIDEMAFFHQINNYKLDDGSFNEKQIHDFVLSIWTSELHHQLSNEKSKLLPFLSEFNEKIKDELKLNQELLYKLVEYCEFVSNARLQNRSHGQLRFGDTFSCEDQTELFFLCITPHCDLVNPKDKLNNNFYFIKGKREYDLERALQNVDSDNYYCSFAWFKKEVIAIQWICKPITFYFDNNNIDSLEISYSGSDYSLKHIALLKENFTQRITNKSFGYGYRVGIDIPYISSELGESE